MANRQSFDAEKAKLDDACEALRYFTLARRGATRKAGVLAVERVKAACARMSRLFSGGSHAARLALLLNSVRPRVLAAEARLALLANKATVASESP
jgi:hypothetical protein